jgi:hypothetical protein
MHRRNKTALAALCVVLTMPAAASAAPGDFASGAFKTSILGGLKGNFTGHGSPLDAHGQIHFDQDIPSSAFSGLKGTVDCVFVHGNSATLTGRLTRGGAGNSFFQMGLTDNGEPPDDPPDGFNLAITPFELGCAFPFDGIFPIEQGNIVVKDNTP